jgi:hypothetical protein
VVGFVVGVPDLLGTGRSGDVGVVGVRVVGGNGPGPSGSTTVVGALSVGDVGVVGDPLSVGVGSVVVVVVVVYFGRS